MRGCLITLLVLVAIAVGVDVGARALAEDRVAAAVATSLNLPAAPDVDVHGFPFLSQALAGRYDDVDLSAPGIRYGDLRDLTLTANLQGVVLPPDALAAGRVSSIPTDTVVAEARVSATDLARVLDAGELTVEPVTAAGLQRDVAAAEADGTGLSGDGDALREVDPATSVRLVSSLPVAGQSVRVSVIASFRLSGTRVTLSARDIRTEDPPAATGSAGRAAARELRTRLSTYSVTVDPGALPFGIRATGLRAEDGVLVVSGTAGDVDLLGTRPS